jgi:nitrate reductase gamma subunit
MTVIFVASILFIVIRRAVAPEVRIITTVGDYLLLALVAAMFLTGYLAYHRWIAFGINYKNILILHILLGELLMILIPFTKLGHMILFFFTRAIIGVEFGARRGSKAW